MRKSLYWVLMMLLVFACLRSGCGGSGGDPVKIDGNNGTWCITAGTLTYQDGSAANYVQGSATADPFTIALSDAGDGSYVLSLSAASGGFMKEGSPYCKVNFEGVNQLVRVVWGTSEDWKNFAVEANSTYKLTNANTYYAKFPSVTHDVKEVAFHLTSASTVRYTQIGPSIEGNSDTSVNVELTLTRVN